MGRARTGETGEARLAQISTAGVALGASLQTGDAVVLPCDSSCSAAAGRRHVGQVTISYVARQVSVDATIIVVASATKTHIRTHLPLLQRQSRRCLICLISPTLSQLLLSRGLLLLRLLHPPPALSAFLCVSPPGE